MPNNNISSIRKKINSCKIMCIGDIMLDHYLFGRIDRISPEAPIPILLFEKEKFIPGGAANVARNISALGAKCILLSVVGNDVAGKKISRQISIEKKIIPKLFTLKKYQTPVKTRYIRKFQHLLRVDREFSNFKISKKLIENIESAILKNIKQTDLIILSDYNKGLISKLLIKKIICIAKKYNKTIIADPKKIDLSTYKGIDILTPNQKEISDAANKNLTSERDLTNFARSLIKKYKFKEVLITRSSKGMLLVGSDYLEKIPANCKNVNDVTGAGDTVISVLSLMKAIGMNTSSAAKIANNAAGITVAKQGTAVLSFRELTLNND